MPTSAVICGRRMFTSSWSLFDSVCPSCSRLTRSRPRSSRTKYGKNELSVRPASNLASSTAVNAKANVQISATRLYDSLNALKSTAANYVNLSRLQLALRSIEVKDEVIREAILGLDAGQSMLKLVEILLSEPNGFPEEWKELLESEAEHRRGLLIRYGEHVAVSKTHTLLITIFLPSALLKRYNIEILVSNLNLESTGVQDTLLSSVPLDTFRVPTLETPASASGRFSLVTYPVHRAIVYGEGLRGCVQLGGLANGPLIPADKSVQLVLNSTSNEWESEEYPNLNVVNIGSLQEIMSSGKVEVGKDTGRETGLEKVEIAKNTRSSKPPDELASLMNWVKAGTESSGLIKPATRHLIETVLSDTLHNINRKEVEQSEALIQASVSQETRQSLTKALEDWAERSHIELRDHLELAFTSRTWQKIAWYKLFWRVDDVAMIASDILQQNWLHEAEKRMIWLSGRLVESNLLRPNEPFLVMTPPIASQAKPRGFASSPPAPTFSDLIPQTVSERIATSSSLSEPWPSEIPLTRAELYKSTIPPLQQLAQKLLIQTLTVSTASTAFAGLLMYAYSPLTSLYEVGFVAALGIVASLKRLQGKWESARSEWESTLREQGRIALSQTNRSIRLILKDGGKPRPDLEEIKERGRARETVEEAHEALRRLD